MLGLDHEQNVAHMWLAILIGLIITTYGTSDAVPEFLKNRAAWRRWRGRDSLQNRIQTLGDYKRSAWFLAAFLVAFLLILRFGADLALNGPPAGFDETKDGAVLAYAFDALMFCFWRSKHADRRATLRLERLYRDLRAREKEEEQK